MFKLLVLEELRRSSLSGGLFYSWDMGTQRGGVTFPRMQKCENPEFPTPISLQFPSQYAMESSEILSKRWVKKRWAEKSREAFERYLKIGGQVGKRVERKGWEVC